MNHEAIQTNELSLGESNGGGASGSGRRLKSLAELGEVADWFEPPREASLPGESLDEVVASLAIVERDLEAATSRDAEARREAEKAFEERDRLLNRIETAADARDRARALLERTERLSRDAFAAETRSLAANLLNGLCRAAETAEAELLRASEGVEALDGNPGVRQLLAERERLAAAARAEAERVARSARLDCGLAAARARLAERDYAAALSALRPLVAEFPDEPAPRSLLAEVDSRLLARRLFAAKSLLWEIRRSLRGRPREALDLLEPLDLAGLDDELASGLFGEWLRAGRELGLPGLLRYAPAPHQGALLAPRADDPDSLEVVAMIGDCRLRRGQIVAVSSLRGLRPASSRR